MIASIDKGTRGSAGRKCPHTASKTLRIHKVFSAAFSLSASISAPAELLRIGQPWIFEGFLFFWTQAGCRPPRTKGQKAPKRLTCPTCVLLLIDAFPFVYKTSRLRWRRDVFVYSCLALARSTPRKYSLVILNITGLSAKSAMKFGIAIRPLSVSAMFQTKSSEETLPTTIMIMKTN